MEGARKTAKTERYSWTQSYEEFVVGAPLPPGLRAKHVKSTVRHRSVKLQIAGMLIAEGKLCGSVDTEECTWTIADGFVELILVKSEAGWWPSLIEGEIYIEDEERDFKAKPADEGKGARKANQRDAVNKQDLERKKERAKQESAVATSSNSSPAPSLSKKTQSKPDPEVSEDKRRRALGKKGHGETNVKGNEGEDITNILEVEEKCQAKFDHLRKTLGIEHEHTLTAAFDLMDQWIGNYRMSKIDQLLTDKEGGLMAICKKKGKDFYMRAVQMLAFCRWKQFRFRDSLKLFYEFQDLAGRSAILLENIGHTHNSLGEVDKAEECFQEALDRIAKGDRGNKGGLLMGLGVAKKSRGDLKGSVEILYEALDYYLAEYKGIEHSIVAKCHTSVGRSLEGLGEWRKAEHHYYEAVHIFWLTCGYSPLTANAVKKLGDAKVQLGFWDDAQQLYRQSFELHASFDTLDMNAILELVSAIQRLHFDERATKELSRPGFNQYVDTIVKVNQRLEKEEAEVDVTGSVYYKLAGEIAMSGGAMGTGVSMLKIALKFFEAHRSDANANATVNLEGLIEQCRHLITALTPPPTPDCPP